jgi:hypothetical protein
VKNYTTKKHCDYPWDRRTITDETVDFSIPDTVFIDRENKTALVRDNNSSVDS